MSGSPYTRPTRRNALAAAIGLALIGTAQAAPKLVVKEVHVTYNDPSDPFGLDTITIGGGNLLGKKGRSPQVFFGYVESTLSC